VKSRAYAKCGKPFILCRIHPTRYRIDFQKQGFEFRVS
jgi:hypothetical protein